MKQQKNYKQNVKAQSLIMEADDIFQLPRFRRDYSKAFHLYQEAEKIGSDVAADRVGWCYSTGSGVDKDLHQAVIHFLKAARMGNANAMYNLGHFMNGEGKGCKMGQQKAIYWFEKAAEKGIKSAYWNLGTAYLKGEGVKIDYDKAIDWFRRGGDQGNTSCYTQVGLMCFQGLGMIEDHEQAVTWFKKAALDENSDACLYLGYCYEHGDGVRRNLKLANDYYEKADMFGNVNALEEIFAFEKRHPFFKLYKRANTILQFVICRIRYSRLLC